MSATFRPWNPDQHWLLPPSVHELVREQLDLSALLSAYHDGRGGTAFQVTSLCLWDNDLRSPRSRPSDSSGVENNAKGPLGGN